MHTYRKVHAYKREVYIASPTYCISAAHVSRLTSMQCTAIGPPWLYIYVVAKKESGNQNTRRANSLNKQ